MASFSAPICSRGGRGVEVVGGGVVVVGVVVVIVVVVVVGVGVVVVIVVVVVEVVAVEGEDIENSYYKYKIVLINMKSLYIHKLKCTSIYLRYLYTFCILIINKKTMHYNAHD
jgi:hypothetical protein